MWRTHLLYIQRVKQNRDTTAVLSPNTTHRSIIIILCGVELSISHSMKTIYSIARHFPFRWKSRKQSPKPSFSTPTTNTTKLVHASQPLFLHSPFWHILVLLYPCWDPAFISASPFFLHQHSHTSERSPTISPFPLPFSISLPATNTPTTLRPSPPLIPTNESFRYSSLPHPLQLHASQPFFRHSPFWYILLLHPCWNPASISAPPFFFHQISHTLERSPSISPFPLYPSPFRYQQPKPLPSFAPRHHLSLSTKVSATLHFLIRFNHLFIISYFTH
jgi:hypothetical protein